MKRLLLIMGILIFLITTLILYILLLRHQLHKINFQLDKRRKEASRQPVRLELMDRELNEMVIKINECFKAEETLRLELLREEKKFRELIANLSHDLRTPLTAVKGYLQLMEYTELSKEQLSKLQTARKHTGELEQLIEHVFEYSYLVNAEPRLTLERINLTNTLTECLAEAVPLFEENNLTLSVQEAPPVFILGDRESVLRIIENLIRNCIQHATGEVRFCLFPCDCAVLSVKNSLNSSSEPDVSRLFDRFYTGDQARGNKTGLGLSIVKLLAEQMGGSTEAILEDKILDIRIRLPLYSQAGAELLKNESARF